MNSIDRRNFLKSTGLGLALPVFESWLSPAEVYANPSNKASAAQRLVCVGTFLGFHQSSFFPEQIGRDYEMSTVLKPVESFRSRMTVFSGLDHRGRNGHEGWKAWMSGSASGSISMDQRVAEEVGVATRYASLQVTCGNPPGAARLSFTKEGVALPMVGRPSVLYKTLFRSDSDKSRIDYLLASNRSVLDGALAEAKSIEAKLSVKDRRKLNEYLASVRDVEKKLRKQRAWLDKPTPKVDYRLPQFDPVSPALALECESIMYDLMALALTTDSTRVITFMVPGWSQVFEIDGEKLSAGYHGLSHHGNDPTKIAEYNLVGQEHVKRFANFLSKIDAAKDAAGRSLLDSTVVVFGSGMGDSNTHDNSNLPTLLVGGGFQHGQHHRIERDPTNTRLLGDLYLTVMQQLGVNEEQFAGAKQNMSEYLL